MLSLIVVQIDLHFTLALRAINCCKIENLPMAEGQKI